MAPNSQDEAILHSESRVQIEALLTSSGKEIVQYGTLVPSTRVLMLSFFVYVFQLTVLAVQPHILVNFNITDP